MRSIHCSWFVAVVSAALVVGCTQGTPPSARSEKPAEKKREREVKVATAESTEPPVSDDPAEPRETKGRRRFAPREPGQLPPAKAPIPLEDVAEAELTMPKVALTQGHNDICKVRVGDSLPDLKLPDLAGKERSLGELLGEKLTVVVFWNGKKPSALEELSDLDPMVARRFGEKGVEVIGVNVGDDPQLAGELAGQAGAKYPMLSDRESNSLDKFAAGRVPQTYLVDAAGKVLWFDLEYSRITRRDLVQAIRFTLAQN